MFDAREVNEMASPEHIRDYLCQRLSAEHLDKGKEYEIRGQGGLYVGKQGDKARKLGKPGEKQGGFGIVGAACYIKTGKFSASGEAFKECLKDAADFLGISDNGNGNGHKQQHKGNGVKPFSQPENTEKPKTPAPDIDWDNPTKAYSYTDEAGNELYQNCRYENDKAGNRLEKKDFRQRHKNASGRWDYSIKGIRRVPYRLHTLAAEPNLIFDCEGEKDAETLISFGFTATSTVEEALSEVASYCKGKGIVICEDNDKPGREKAAKKAEAYWKAGAGFVKILTFRNMPEKSDVTDWVRSDPRKNDVFEIQNNVIDTPEYSPLESLRVTFFHEPQPRRTVIEIDGQRALPSGNIGGLVAGIGVGKSNFIEMLASLALDADCEPFSGIKIHLDQHEKVVIVDTERTKDDCLDTLFRIWRRCGQKKDLLTPDKSAFRRLDLLTLTELEDLADRREKLLMILERPDIRLVLVDGLLDFIGNANDPVESGNFVSWLFTMAVKHDKAVFCTVHGNRNDLSGKGKGWLGDIMQRKSSCFLMLRRHSLDPDVKVITSDFENVKMRHGRDTDINKAMKWNDDFHAFRFIEYQQENAGKPSRGVVYCQCFEKKEKFLKNELASTYSEVGGVSIATAYRHIDKDTGVILKTEQIGNHVFYLLGNQSN